MAPLEGSAVWANVAGHVARLLAQDGVLDNDADRLKHVRYFAVNVGTSVLRDEPVRTDDLERLAAAAIHWAIQQTPDQEEPPS